MVYFPATVRAVLLVPEVHWTCAAAAKLEFTWWCTEPVYLVASILSEKKKKKIATKFAGGR